MAVMKRLSAIGSSKPGKAAGTNGPGITGDLKSIKRSFLDRQAVINRFDRMALRNLRRFGALTRSLARRSMRKGGKKQAVSQFSPELKALMKGRTRDSSGRFLANEAPEDIQPWPVVGSEPGKLPKSRWSRMLKDKIFFVALPNKRSVVIGPHVFDRDDVPGLLEFGGTSNDEAKTWVAFWYGGKRLIRLAEKGGKRIRLKPRPYMEPAYEKALDRLIPDIYRDSI